MAHLRLSQLRLSQLPGVQQVRTYRREYLSGDLLAGLLVAALAVPQALGYAAVAGVPVQVGLYTLPPALLAYALIGTSRVLFVGPVSTVSVLSGSIVHQMSGGDPARAAELTSALAIAAGAVLLAAGVLRVGWVAQFLSAPIVTGFVTGLVVLIVVGEVPGLLGLATPTGTLIDRLLALARTVGNANATTAGIAAVALVLLFGGNRLAPRVPWSLVVLVGGVVVSHLAGLSSLGARTVGAVPGGLHLPNLPTVQLVDLPGLATGGLAVAAVGIAEGLAAARTFAAGRERLDDDAELLANGVADLAAGLVGGIGVAGSLSKTAANARAGARTQLSGVAAAAVVLLVLLLAAPALSPLPRAVLSAIVINAVWGLVHPREFLRYRAVRRNDGIAAVVAFVGVLAVGPLNGLLVAIGQSLLGMIYRSVQVHVDEMGKVAGEKAAWGAVDHDAARRTVRGVVVLRADSLMFWANVDTVIDRIYERVDARPDARVVLLDMEATNQLDTTTADRMDAMLTDLRSHGIDLYLVRVFAPVRLVLTRTGFLDRLGDDHVWHSISAGVKAAKHALPLVPAQGRPDGGAAVVTDSTDSTDSTDDVADAADEVMDAGESTDDERIAARRSRPVNGS